MALDALQEKYIPRDNTFYQRYYHYFLIGLMSIVMLMLVLSGVILYQMTHKPLPVFFAKQADGKTMPLTSYAEPNLLPKTILDWASKAAITAYTFQFQAEKYEEELKLARPYFTDAGWQVYLRSANDLIQQIVKGQLFVYSVVSGTPVIDHQGPLPGVDYAWRVQIPFLVTYVSANTVFNRKFMVLLTIVRVPTSSNPQGIGIDQFIMVAQ